MLNKISHNIWTVEGEAVSFYGMPYTTRMTVIRLKNNALWLHSPLAISEELIQELKNLGEVKFLISPNKLHHLFLPDWIKQYPNALTFSSPGLKEKRTDIQFNKALQMTADPLWEEEIDQTIFKGSSAMQEVIFLHKSSKTLILTDLIENFKPDTFNWWQKPIAKFSGIVSPHGKTPLDWRMSFIFGKKAAKKSFETMLQWQPEHIIISHGKCIIGNGTEFLKSSFSWV
ncbi:DUF4336 domain-containing protein [Pseudoalteromonas denitrificans]|uniref:DUF4336 domain-containing protein n=1 Tax=Pseudoalteromonas denitrificans DSM 6059 TaxID=1123010 RepID=A0A1I1N9S2_9GAMM|nr:DUF4336 domain-containing protein [Pseudoalteromonas denitrificans]SFC92218.1 protein of unknown function [Pseudoalteromonas denitrificans DSM 6059]